MSVTTEVEDTFAEAFPMLASRILITADNEKWALTAARAATGFATSIIMSPAEAGVEGVLVPPEKTPDGRPGAVVQIYHTSRPALKAQIISRLGQCVLTCPTTAAFNALPDAKKRLKVGAAIRLFGDGFERKDTVSGRKVWRIPVMEGEFIIERRLGIKRAVAGGNFIIMAKDQTSGLRAAERAVEAMGKVEGVILSFPGGVCRSGSKVGSVKYKLPASTNHLFCPTLKGVAPNSMIPEGVRCVYEIVFNALDLDLLKKATAAGLRGAMGEGVVKITAVNFGGKLGPFQIRLKEAIAE